MQKEAEQLEIKRQQQQQLIKEHQAKEKEFEARRRDLEQQQDKAIADLASPALDMAMKRLCNGLTSIIGIGNLKVFDEDAPAKKVKALKEARREALEKEQLI